MASSSAPTVWIGTHWVTGAGFMAAGFLALTPLLADILPAALLLIFLHTPGYMIHQVEEHQGDRFRRFTNDRLFGGLDVLRTIDVLVINLPLVWGLNLTSLYAALAWGPGHGLSAPYAMLLNAIVHFGAAVRLRAYNPGLITAAAIFVPLSILTIWMTARAPSVTFDQHAFGVAVALIVHGLIIAQAVRRLGVLRRHQE